MSRILDRMKANGHQKKNIHTEAIKGMGVISKQVEHVRGAQMSELADKKPSGGGLVYGGRVNTPVVNSDMLTPQDQVGPTMSSNIIEEVLPIVVTRNSYNIAYKLPFVLFAPVNLIEQYSSILAFVQTLKAGIVVTTSIFENNKVRFTYTDGSDVDTIDISTNFVVPYPVILKMLETDWFQAKGIKYTAGEGNYNSQFGSFALGSGRTTFAGIANFKSTPVSAFKRTDQFQLNMVNLDATIRINGRRYIALGMAAAAVDPGDETINLDLFLEGYGSAVDFAGGSVCS